MTGDTSKGEAMRPEAEPLEIIAAWAVHDLTTSIMHKGETPGRLDEDCAVLGQAIADRIRAGRSRWDAALAEPTDATK
jgi:hypothetical protein